MSTPHDRSQQLQDEELRIKEAQARLLEAQLKQLMMSEAPRAAGDLEKMNKEAQTKLFNTQIEQLKSPVSVWDWLGRLLANPQAAVAFLSMLVAALAVGASITNARLTTAAARETSEVNRRNYEEQQLGLALARTGDKDSPLARTSGAGLLARIATRPQTDADTIENILEQLNHALRSETDEVVLGAIVDALLKLIDRKPDEAFKFLGYSNRLFQQRLIDAAVEYFVALGLRSASDVTDEHWQKIARATRLTPTVLKRLVSPQRYSDHYQQEWQRRSEISVAPNEEAPDEAWKQLRTAALRLEQSDQLCRRLLLPQTRTSATAKKMWDGLFLARADLRNADLRGVNLKNAELEGAKLSGAKIDDTTKLLQADWWQADFSSEDGSQIDKSLLETLFKLHGSEVPADSSSLHDSVLRYLQGRPSP